MAKGTIPVTNIPGWPSPPDGVMEACENAVANGYVTITPNGIETTDTTAVQNVLSSFVGSATQLSLAKTRKQAALDDAFDKNFDLTKFIRGGTVTTITAANIGNFLATITNNYRSLRAQIANAATMTALNAININAGWPSNP